MNSFPSPDCSSCGRLELLAHEPSFQTEWNKVMTRSLTAAKPKRAKKKHSETFTYLGNQYKFDITRAIEFCQDGREPVEVDDDDVRFSLKKVRINKKHVPTVDTQKPGIIAVVFHPGPDGTQIKGQRLIDGHHRAARCLELGIPFQAYLLNEEESAAILLKSLCKPELDPATCKGLIPSCELRQQEARMEARDHNREAWNDRVARKGRFTRPADSSYLERRSGQLAAGWLPEGVAGKRVLLLGGGGGRQSAKYAQAGAIVTVVDISDAMLDLDRAVAKERGYELTLVETSMEDLSMLAEASFDIVNQPVSACYVPDISAVYREVARVVKPGGLYIGQHKQPSALQASMRPSPRGYEVVEPYYHTGSLRPVTGTLIREEGTLEFLHTWENLIGGLCRSGFVVEDLVEPRHGDADAKPGSFDHFCAFFAPYVRIKARRIASAV